MVHCVLLHKMLFRLFRLFDAIL